MFAADLEELDHLAFWTGCRCSSAAGSPRPIRQRIITPISQGARVAVGDQVEVQISLRAEHEAEYVHLGDPRAAGLEPENAVSRFKWDLGIGWYREDASP